MAAAHDTTRPGDGEMVSVNDVCQPITLPETNSKFAPENRHFATKEKERLPTIHFQVRTVSFREGKCFFYDLLKSYFTLQCPETWCNFGRTIRNHHLGWFKHTMTSPEIGGFRIISVLCVISTYLVDFTDVFLSLIFFESEG